MIYQVRTELGCGHGSHAGAPLLFIGLSTPNALSNLPPQRTYDRMAMCDPEPLAYTYTHRHASASLHVQLTRAVDHIPFRSPSITRTSLCDAIVPASLGLTAGNGTFVPVHQLSPETAGRSGSTPHITYRRISTHLTAHYLHFLQKARTPSDSLAAFESSRRSGTSCSPGCFSGSPSAGRLKKMTVGTSRPARAVKLPPATALGRLEVGRCRKVGLGLRVARHSPESFLHPLNHPKSFLESGLGHAAYPTTRSRTCFSSCARPTRGMTRPQNDLRWSCFPPTSRVGALPRQESRLIQHFDFTVTYQAAGLADVWEHTYPAVGMTCYYSHQKCPCAVTAAYLWLALR